MIILFPNKYKSIIVTHKTSFKTGSSNNVSNANINEMSNTDINNNRPKYYTINNNINKNDLITSATIDNTKKDYNTNELYSTLNNNNHKDYERSKNRNNLDMKYKSSYDKTDNKSNNNQMMLNSNNNENYSSNQTPNRGNNSNRNLYSLNLNHNDNKTPNPNEFSNTNEIGRNANMMNHSTNIHHNSKTHQSQHYSYSNNNNPNTTKNKQSAQLYNNVPTESSFKNNNDKEIYNIHKYKKDDNTNYSVNKPITSDVRYKSEQRIYRERKKLKEHYDINYNNNNDKLPNNDYMNSRSNLMLSNDGGVVSGDNEEMKFKPSYPRYQSNSNYNKHQNNTNYQMYNSINKENNSNFQQYNMSKTGGKQSLLQRGLLQSP